MIPAEVTGRDQQPLPEDPQQLKQLVSELRHSNTEAEKRILLLEEQVRLFFHKLYGSKAEHCSQEDQLQARLFNEAEIEEQQPESQAPTEPVVTEVDAHRRRRGIRKPLPEGLPREEILHDLPEEQKRCACGAQLSRIGQETSEQLDIIPAQVRVLHHVRPKYACKVCEGVHSEAIHPTVQIAPPPAQMIPKSMASSGLLAHLLVSKFADGLPFYRQEKLFARIGVQMPRATMCNWAMQVAQRCAPLLDLMRQRILEGPLVGIDETPLQVLNEPDRAATTKSYMWVFRGGSPEAATVVYLYHPTRAGAVPRDYLQAYQGYVQTDGYTAYDELGRRSGVVMLGCWAHARRKYVEVEQASKNAHSAHVALGYIKKLYIIEHRADALELDSDGRREFREQHSRPLLLEFRQWVEARSFQTPPTSLLGKAFSYTLGQWDRLERYLEDGILTPDNNLVENAIRPFAVGRKAWLFSYHPAGAAASAALYSLIESAKANGLEPYHYLRYLFDRLPAARGDPEALKKLLPQQIDPSQLAVPINNGTPLHQSAMAATSSG